MSVNYLAFSFPGVPQVRCAFQTRTQGADSVASAGGNISYDVGTAAHIVAANRASLLAALQPLGLQAWAELRQVHGDVLIFEPETVAPEEQARVEGDGMATAAAGLGLLIKTADCQPILLAHREGGHVAAIHAGWRGNRCDFPITAVERFCQRYNLAPAEVLAVRGPSLGPQHAEFVNFAREWGQDWLPWFDPQSQTMDLWALTRAQLIRAGLLARNIFGLDWCTAENSALFFSYRREKTCGRQASLIWISAAQG
ncbi:MAG: laccase domain-containing protein [Desulfovibrio sp.]|nr:laccase domain-containing protein [Desulfovibrio sp.]